jgi:hypothetical protein
MGDVSYKPLISDMTWSYSRIKAFEDCRYAWYLNYIRFPGREGKKLFFASYGTFMHELLEAFNKGEKTALDLQAEYLENFRLRVATPAPNEKVFTSYFMDGLDHLRRIQLSENRVLSVEGRIEFEVGGVPFVGYIDLVEEAEDSSIILIDNKSRALKPRSNRKKPTKTDQELDDYLRQLYLYSAFIKEAYGRFPEKLCFNCFRKGVFIEERFNEDVYDKAIAWFLERIGAIIEETDFYPDVDWFRCRYLCDHSDICEYFELSQRR